jgi:HEAT repeat protein
VARKRGILLAVLLIAVAGIVYWRIAAPPEPAYAGESLSQWLKEYDPRLFIANKDEVDDAIRHIGTNAVPTLLEMLRSRDSAIKSSVQDWGERKDIWFFNRAEDRNVEAARGFEILGDSAKDALPALIAIYEEKISPESQSATAYALGFIGPAAQKAIPQLLPDVTNSNKALSLSVVWSLGRICSAPEVAVPALVEALDDTDRGIRWEAAYALRNFGTNASAAVPALLKARNTQDKLIKGMAAEALTAIDSEAGPSAGTK